MEPLKMSIGTQSRTGQGSGTLAEVPIKIEIEDTDDFAGTLPKALRNRTDGSVGSSLREASQLSRDGLTIPLRSLINKWE